MQNKQQKAPEAKILTKQADRAARVASNNPRASRTAAADAAKKKAETYVKSRATAASTSSSGIGGKVGEKLSNNEKKE